MPFKPIPSVIQQVFRIYLEVYEIIEIDGLSPDVKALGSQEKQNKDFRKMKVVACTNFFELC